ncbi:MAG: GAF domain-containing protein [Verrucomicrobium sp.]
MSSAYGDFSTTTTMRWLPEPRVAPLVPAIEERVTQFATLIRAANLQEFLDPLMTRLIHDCFRDAGAHEGVIWLLDSSQRNLLCAYQVGAASSRLVNFRMPVDSGMAGMVLATQQPFCENNLSTNPSAASKLDEVLGMMVCSRILAPFFISGQMRGIIACYRTKTGPDAADPPPFELDSMEEVTLLTRLLGRLLDHKLLCAAIGVDES